MKGTIELTYESIQENICMTQRPEYCFIAVRDFDIEDLLDLYSNIKKELITPCIFINKKFALSLEFKFLQNLFNVNIMEALFESKKIFNYIIQDTFKKYSIEIKHQEEIPDNVILISEPDLFEKQYATGLVIGKYEIVY